VAKLGKRTKLTAEVRRRICKSLEIGMTKADAAASAGIAASTLHRWIVEGEEAGEGLQYDFAQAVELANAASVERRLERIERHATGCKGLIDCPHCGEPIEAMEIKPNLLADLWMLERRHGYTKDGRLSVELSGPGGSPIQLQQAAPTMEEIRLLLDQVPPNELEAALHRANPSRWPLLSG